MMDEEWASHLLLNSDYKSTNKTKNYALLDVHTRMFTPLMLPELLKNTSLREKPSLEGRLDRNMPKLPFECSGTTD